MTPERYAEIEAAFAEARRLTGGERQAFLESLALRDGPLHSAVAELLTGAADSGFLFKPLVGSAFALQALGATTSASAGQAASPSADAPAQIGPYRILRSIGEGGMGTVYEAEQLQPIARRVAVKVVKWGMDTPEVMARFESERQALALMDHPNIARVLDAGATETGRPYFVMELVRGEPITQYCDAARLSLRARLELFVQVCHAVQHAHQKGVIHRDLKPGNVLVATADGAPLSKVIDFGIAKATSGRLADQTLITRMQQVVGTPAYMSPEQVECGAADIDTRSDVYALGAMLYELLTGQLPFDAARLRAAGLAELQRMIRDDVPAAPSSRIGTRGDAATQLAARRRIDPQRLRRALAGDLDWIVMRCLEKERTRRYDSAGALAQDLSRHLSHEPVAAGPPTLRYRLGKLIARHRVTAGATIVVFASLALGLAGTTALYFRAERQRLRAEFAEQQSSTNAQVAEQRRAEAILAAHRADQSANAAREQLNRTTALTQLARSMLQAGSAFDVAGRGEMTIRDAAERAVAELDTGRFELGPRTEADLRSFLSEVFSGNGLYDQWVCQNRRVLELLEAHFADPLELARARLSLAAALTWSRDFDAAEQLLEQVRSACQEYAGLLRSEDLNARIALGRLYRGTQRRPAAITALREAIREIEAGEQVSPGWADAAYETLSITYRELGRIDEATYWARRTLEFALEHNPSGHMRIAVRTRQSGQLPLGPAQVGGSGGGLPGCAARDAGGRRQATRAVQRDAQRAGLDLHRAAANR